METVFNIVMTTLNGGEKKMGGKRGVIEDDRTSPDRFSVSTSSSDLSPLPELISFYESQPRKSVNHLSSRAPEPEMVLP